MAHITLKGNPRSTGTIYKIVCRGRFGSYYVSNEGKATKEAYILEATNQWRKAPLKGDLEIGIKLYFGTKRRCDWDNFHKLSMDALTGIVWVDDSQIRKATVEKFYNKEAPRIEIDLVGCA